MSKSCWLLLPSADNGITDKRDYTVSRSRGETESGEERQRERERERERRKSRKSPCESKIVRLHSGHAFAKRHKQKHTDAGLSRLPILALSSCVDRRAKRFVVSSFGLGSAWNEELVLVRWRVGVSSMNERSHRSKAVDRDRWAERDSLTILANSRGPCSAICPIPIY